MTSPALAGTRAHARIGVTTVGSSDDRQVVRAAAWTPLAMVAAAE